MTRRRWLVTAGAGLLGACRSKARPLVDARSASVDSLIQDLAAADADRVSEVAVDALARGVPQERLLAAAFLLPIVTGGDREDVHSILAVPSIEALTEAMPVNDAFPAVVWAANNAHAWMVARPDLSARSSGASSTPALLAAIHAGDPERARTSAEALCSQGETRAVTEALILEGARARTDPHGAIYVAQSLRALRGPASGHAPRVWGSVASHLARARTDGEDPTPLRPGTDQSASATDIAQELRRAPDARLDGLAPRAVWGALALLTIETMLVDTSVSGVGPHRVTLLDALAHLYREAPESMRGQILVRATDWVPREHRRVVGDRRPVTELDPDGAGYTPGANPHGDTTFRRALASASVDEGRFVGNARRHMLAHGTGEHDFKHTAAVLSLLPHLPPDARARWLASASLAFGMRSEGRWARRSKVEARLRERGVGG